MAFDYIRPVGPIYFSDATGPLYTGPATTTTYIRNMIFHNTNNSTGGTATATVHLVPNGDSVSKGNRIMALDIQPNETIIMEFATPGIVLETNDSFHGKCNTLNAVTFTMNGGQE